MHLWNWCKNTWASWTRFSHKCISWILLWNTIYVRKRDLTTCHVIFWKSLYNWKITKTTSLVAFLLCLRTNTIIERSTNLSFAVVVFFCLDHTISLSSPSFHWIIKHQLLVYKVVWQTMNNQKRKCTIVVVSIVGSISVIRQKKGEEQQHLTNDVDKQLFNIFTKPLYNPTTIRQAQITRISISFTLPWDIPSYVYLYLSLYQPWNDLLDH